MRWFLNYYSSITYFFLGVAIGFGLGRIIGPPPPGPGPGGTDDDP